MGYTHYWTDLGMGASLPAEAVHHIHAITEHAYRAGIIQRDHDDPRSPRVTPQQVRFSGVGDGGHQTFRFCTAREDTFACCKTAHKPYDAVVMRVLLVLGYYREGLVIRSDGAFSAEWVEALRGSTARWATSSSTSAWASGAQRSLATRPSATVASEGHFVRAWSHHPGSHSVILVS